jgi:hypothetical protein
VHQIIKVDIFAIFIHSLDKTGKHRTRKFSREEPIKKLSDLLIAILGLLKVLLE